MIVKSPGMPVLRLSMNAFFLLPFRRVDLTLE